MKMPSSFDLVLAPEIISSPEAVKPLTEGDRPAAIVEKSIARNENR